MKILIVCIVLLGVCSWCLCASIPKDSHDDEEQIKYLKEWREKHKR